jgi:hypothetical protein
MAPPHFHSFLPGLKDQGFLKGIPMNDNRFSRSKATFNVLNYLVVAAVCFVVASCTGSILPGVTNTPQCQSNCAVGSGVQGVQVVNDLKSEQLLPSNMSSCPQS